jgi:hypothetical protein
MPLMLASIAFLSNPVVAIRRLGEALACSPGLAPPVPLRNGARTRKGPSERPGTRPGPAAPAILFKELDMIKRERKLSLSRDTLLHLENPADLRQIHGGIVSTDDPFGCLRYPHRTFGTTSYN